MDKIKSRIAKTKENWQTFNGHDKIILFAVLGYLVIVSAFMVWHQEFFSPDRFFVFAFLGMLLLGRAWQFFWDWMPWILLILGYDYLRGLVPQISGRVHVHAMIYFDKLLFGVVPTIALQHRFFTDGHIRWYDQAAVILYFLHFVVPFLAAVVFWIIDRHIFKQYMAAMVVLSYAAFVTYFLFPAMPPWMAGQMGFLPPVAHIMDQVLAHFAHPVNLPTVYNYVGANLVAAVPSLHAAYPLMMALFMQKKWPKWGLLAFAYPFAMWFAVVYLGEHYVFDVVVGIIYTLSIFILVTDHGGARTRLKLLWLKLINAKPAGGLAVKEQLS
jgi:hypothetical protein